MRHAWLLIACAAALPALSSLRAQQPRATPCQVWVDSAAPRQPQRVRIVRGDDGSTTMFAGAGVWAHCENDTTTAIYADSMHYVQTTGILELVGNVSFRDSVSTLRADHVTYYLRLERLLARHNVVTTRIRNGSTLSGPHLDYARAAPGVRDTVELLAEQRPTIHFYPGADSVPADSARVPFVIVGNTVRMRGNSRMWGSGDVTIDRPDLHTRADSAELNLADSLGVLIGAPVVTGRDTTTGDTTTYRLTGQRIDFELTGQHQVKRVISRGDADARGTGWRLTADTLDMAVDSGRIERTQAWGDERRPVAVSGPSTIVADSMDIHMPGQKMRLVWAWGSARALTRDTAARDTAQDWLVGDSLRADFVERPSPQDSARTRTEIDSIISFGHARAYYHVVNERDSTGRRGINYSRGDRITIAMAERRVRTVDIVGEVDGLYLEPMVLDSAALDSLRQDSVLADSLRRLAPARDTAAVRADTTGQPRPAPARESPAARPAPAPPGAEPRPVRPRRAVPPNPRRRP